MSNSAERIEVNGKTVGWVQQMTGPGEMTGKWQVTDGHPHKFMQAWDTRDDAVEYLFDRHDARAAEQRKA